jgi:hypothetical protein
VVAEELKPESYLEAVGRLLEDVLNARAAGPSSHTLKTPQSAAIA